MTDSNAKRRLKELDEFLRDVNTEKAHVANDTLGIREVCHECGHDFTAERVEKAALIRGYNNGCRAHAKVLLDNDSLTCALRRFVQLFNQERELGVPVSEDEWIAAHDRAREVLNGDD